MRTRLPYQFERHDARSVEPWIGGLGNLGASIITARQRSNEAGADLAQREFEIGREDEKIATQRGDVEHERGHRATREAETDADDVRDFDERKRQFDVSQKGINTRATVTGNGRRATGRTSSDIDSATREATLIVGDPNEKFLPPEERKARITQIMAERDRILGEREKANAPQQPAGGFMETIMQAIGPLMKMMGGSAAAPGAPATSNPQLARGATAMVNGPAQGDASARFLAQNQPMPGAQVDAVPSAARAGSITDQFAADGKTEQKRSQDARTAFGNAAYRAGMTDQTTIGTMVKTLDSGAVETVADMLIRYPHLRPAVQAYAQARKPQANAKPTLLSTLMGP